MRIRLACSFALALVVVTTGRSSAEVPADSITLTLKTPKSVDVADSTTFDDFTEPTDDVRPREFNLARCVCDEGPATHNVLFDAKWAMSPPAMSAGNPLFAWAGSSCASAANRAEREMTCSRLDGIQDAVDLNDGERIFVEVGDLLTPGTNNATCNENLTQITYGLYTSTDGEGTITKVVEVPIAVDMKPPPVPTSLTVYGQEGEISLGWDALSSEAGDIRYFQALCATVAGSPAHTMPTHAPQFDTARSLCGASLAPTIDAATFENPDDQLGADITEMDLGELAVLDHAFICGQSSGSTSQGVTLKGLANGVDYIVVLVSVDKAGNASAVYVPKTVAPAPVTDFWEDLNEENGEIEGGLCLVEATYGAGGGGLNGALRAWRDDLRQSSLGSWFVDRYYQLGAPLAAAARESVVARVVIGLVMLPLVVIALVWHTLGLPAMLALALALVVLRRRRKLVVAATIALAPSLAAAQSMTPYWDDEMASESAENEGPKWHFGIRLGPYLPSIDDERFDAMPGPGPYERMFGGGGWMPVIDLHRIWGTRFGQIGGGGSVGYFSKTADAFIPGSDERAVGNENSLKIIPMELTAIWRGSMFHDNWGVPLVPYVRGGLGYYLWWVRRPDGEFAKACPPNMTNCDRAIGASMGLVGAAGLSIRAEGIDPSAARSMRDSGLDHAGFYAEVEMAWVDGFGSAKKLSLGDTTWFAGIDFEF